MIGPSRNHRWRRYRWWVRNDTWRTGFWSLNHDDDDDDALVAFSLDLFFCVYVCCYCTIWLPLLSPQRRKITSQLFVWHQDKWVCKATKKMYSLLVLVAPIRYRNETTGSIRTKGTFSYLSFSNDYVKHIMVKISPFQLWKPAVLSDFCIKHFYFT